MNANIKEILKSLRSEFESLYGERLSRILLFGSQARGDAAPDSDIDVLVVLNGEVQAGEEIARTGRVVANLSLMNDVVINCVFMDEHRFSYRDGPLLRNIRREGITV